ncbi:hypothetical protein Ae717Ps2_6368 [Pseudonocardia sp. Ae717_Ps2]|nr:hypothetical protein Ae717Ps2_6368 [Pseudonocardia sp. Ae717_Ps2]
MQIDPTAPGVSPLIGARRGPLSDPRKAESPRRANAQGSAPAADRVDVPAKERSSAVADRHGTGTGDGAPRRHTHDARSAVSGALRGARGDALAPAAAGAGPRGAGGASAGPAAERSEALVQIDPTAPGVSPLIGARRGPLSDPRKAESPRRANAQGSAPAADRVDVPAKERSSAVADRHGTGTGDGAPRRHTHDARSAVSGALRGARGDALAPAAAGAGPRGAGGASAGPAAERSEALGTFTNNSSAAGQDGHDQVRREVQSWLTLRETLPKLDRTDPIAVQDRRSDRRAERWAIRKGLRQVAQGRTASCGLPGGRPDGSVVLRVTDATGTPAQGSTGATGRVAGFSGLWSCGSVWMCPECSVKIAASARRRSGRSWATTSAPAGSRCWSPSRCATTASTPWPSAWPR